MSCARGGERGGKSFDKSTLFMLLGNEIYRGKIKHKENTYPGEHEAIVDDELFEMVKQMLQRNGRGGGLKPRNKHGALLKGLLRCQPCDCSMGCTYSSKGTLRYRYYV